MTNAELRGRLAALAPTSSIDPFPGAGIPVGRSYLVTAFDEAIARTEARRLARQDGCADGSVLYVDCIEPGVYEVILDTGERIEEPS